MASWEVLVLHPSFCRFAIGRGHSVLMSRYFRVRSYETFFFYKNNQVFFNDVFRVRLEKQTILEGIDVFLASAR